MGSAFFILFFAGATDGLDIRRLRCSSLQVNSQLGIDLISILEDTRPIETARHTIYPG